MAEQEITEQDRKLAQQCMNCPMCKRARRNQRGLAFWFVKTVEGGVCPACRAYEKVYGKKAHEPTEQGGVSLSETEGTRTPP